MDFKNLKVLYVEDEKEIRDSMAQILSLEIKELFLAENGKEALEVYKKIKPDIIIADINMPKINGLEFVRQVRQSDQSVRVIMLTAQSDVQSLLESTELKLTRYLIKPVTGRELFSSLEKALCEINSFQVVNKQTYAIDEEYLWDFKESILLYKNEEIHLTPKEKKILNLMFSHLNMTVSYDMLLQDVWENDDVYGIDTIKTTIKNLRRKLPKDTIGNVYGTGFRVKS